MFSGLWELLQSLPGFGVSEVAEQKQLLFLYFYFYFVCGFSLLSDCELGEVWFCFPISNLLFASQFSVFISLPPALFTFIYRVLFILLVREIVEQPGLVFSLISCTI